MGATFSIFAAAWASTFLVTDQVSAARVIGLPLEGRTGAFVLEGGRVNSSGKAGISVHNDIVMTVNGVVHKYLQLQWPYNVHTTPNSRKCARSGW